MVCKDVYSFKYTDVLYLSVSNSKAASERMSLVIDPAVSKMAKGNGLIE